MLVSSPVHQVGCLGGRRRRTLGGARRETAAGGDHLCGSCLTAFERTRQGHGVLQCSWLREFHVGAQGLLEPGRENRDLLCFRDSFTARQEDQELILVFVDGRGAAQMREFAERIAAQRRAKAAIDALNELRPRRDALVLLEAVVPLARSVLEVERRSRDLEMVRRAVGVEELLPFV